jgi:hypothetical protein
MREIAKAQGRSVFQSNEVIDRWAESAITDKIREHTLAVTRSTKEVQKCNI